MRSLRTCLRMCPRMREMWTLVFTAVAHGSMTQMATDERTQFVFVRLSGVTEQQRDYTAAVIL